MGIWKRQAAPIILGGILSGIDWSCRPDQGAASVGGGEVMSTDPDAEFGTISRLGGHSHWEDSFRKQSCSTLDPFLRTGHRC